MAIDGRESQQKEHRREPQSCRAANTQCRYEREKEDCFGFDLQLQLIIRLNSFSPNPQDVGYTYLWRRE